MPETLPPRSGRTRLLLAVALMSGISACGGGGGSSPTSPGNTNTNSNVIASVSIGGNTTSVVVGASATLDASARNASGSTVPATFSWTSSNTSVLTVGSSTGVITGVSVGNAIVTATSGGFSATRTISVANVAGGGAGPAPTSAQISMPDASFEPNAVTVAVGGVVTFVFTAIAHDVRFGSGSGVTDIPVTTNSTVTRTFNTKGTFSILCTLHAGMTGSVTVQ